jgi:hypothetical protein
MAVKSKTQRNEHKMDHPLNDMADKARKQYEDAIRTGQKLQEEAGQWWTKMLGQAATANDWQKQFTTAASITGRMLPMAQQRMEDTMELIELNSRTGADLMKKAMDAAQTTGLAESQAKWLDFWASSMRALQGNVEAVNEMNTKAMNSWIQFARSNAERSEEFRTMKAA